MPLAKLIFDFFYITRNILLRKTYKKISLATLYKV
ncbi:MAG: hypothetical protein MRECE_26c013 [Mycoplasmataceae bacterium CE_OT135]|nr:MAG: hypothetical protein MRECE_26c013 [Mycoplasmataceae bacterium CE_OT135]